MDNIENKFILTDEQLALIIGEKVTGTVSQGAKRDEYVIDSANVFLRWLRENKTTNQK